MGDLSMTNEVRVEVEGFLQTPLVRPPTLSRLRVTEQPAILIACEHSPSSPQTTLRLVRRSVRRSAVVRLVRRSARRSAVVRRSTVVRRSAVLWAVATARHLHGETRSDLWDRCSAFASGAKLCRLR